MTATDNARETVLACVKAIQSEDFKRTRELVDNDFSFVGVLGSVRGGDNYVEQMKKLHFKYNVKKVFADGSDVCLLSDVVMGETSVFTCSWYTVDGGKIRSLRVVFDPRPVLQGAPAAAR
ncbi:MAG TPA: nuclear transport factor 2 family protein [Terracidiphilus sp.]|nr:nuclear transport factor 2 family protein [Terracidiphilus sp.]